MPRFEDPMEYPFAAEAAAALGYAGRKLRKTLDALRDFDQAEKTKQAVRSANIRAELVADAAEAFWSYVVQREEFGLLDPEYIREQYAVPDEVWWVMGPKRKT